MDLAEPPIARVYHVYFHKRPVVVRCRVLVTRQRDLSHQLDPTALGGKRPRRGKRLGTGFDFEQPLTRIPRGNESDSRVPFAPGVERYRLGDGAGGTVAGRNHTHRYRNAAVAGNVAHPHWQPFAH